MRNDMSNFFFKSQDNQGQPWSQCTESLWDLVPHSDAAAIWRECWSEDVQSHGAGLIALWWSAGFWTRRNEKRFQGGLPDCDSSWNRRWQIQSSSQQALRQTKGLLTTSGVQSGEWVRGPDAPHLAQPMPGNVSTLWWAMADAGFRHEIVGNRNEVHQQAVWGTGLRPPGQQTDERYLRSLRDLGWSYRTWRTLLMTLSPVVGQRSLAYGGLRLPEWFPNPPTGEAKASAGWLQGRTLSTSGRVGSLRGLGVYKYLGLGADARGHGHLENQAQSRPFWNPRIWDSPSEGKGLGGTDQSRCLGSWEVVTNTNHFR